MRTYRDPRNNHWLTKGLFTDFDKETGGEHSVMSLDEVHKLYLDSNDPTEYTVMQALVKNIDHWEYLCKSPWFDKVRQVALRELEVKMQSEGLALIVDEVRNDGKSAYQAAKFLVQKEWATKGEPKQRGRGRPKNKDEVLEYNGWTEEELNEIAGRIN